MRRRQGRSKRGTPAIVRVDGLHNRNMSVLVAMSPVYCILMCYTRIQAFDGETFTAFLKALADKLRRDHPNHNFVFVLDNAKFHTCAEVQNVRPQLGFLLKYLPPYSPFLNPIEECFSKWKDIIKEDLAAHVPSAPESTQDKHRRMTVAAERAMNAITPSDCLGWNSHSKSFWADCRDGIPINTQPVNDPANQQADQSNNQ